MQAVIYQEYGKPEVLTLAEIEKPVPKENEILIKLYATSVTTGDYRARSLDLPTNLFWLPARLIFGLTKPKQPVLGQEFAGEIVGTGNDVTKFKVGEKVFGSTGAKFGTYTEYIVIEEDGVVATLPQNLQAEEAVVLPFGGLTALYFLRDLGHVKRGEKVLINGASGSIGTYAVQLAKLFGAEVTGVCSSTNVELVKSLGADYVIDYTKEDFTQVEKTWDVILDTVGKITFQKSKDSLSEKGRYLAVVMTGVEMWQIVRTSFSGGKKVLSGVTNEKLENLLYLKELVEAGKVKPVIDRSYPIEEIVEAHRYVEKGHKKGNVLINIQS